MIRNDLASSYRSPLNDAIFLDWDKIVRNRFVFRDYWTKLKLTDWTGTERILFGEEMSEVLE